MHLSFRGTFYQQTFGMAMGSPVSVTVAYQVKEEIEGQAISMLYLCLQIHYHASLEEVCG